MPKQENESLSVQSDEMKKRTAAFEDITTNDEPKCYEQCVEAPEDAKTEAAEQASGLNGPAYQD